MFDFFPKSPYFWAERITLDKQQNLTNLRGSIMCCISSLFVALLYCFTAHPYMAALAEDFFPQLIELPYKRASSEIIAE